jgi:hypothetical protein
MRRSLFIANAGGEGRFKEEEGKGGRQGGRRRRRRKVLLTAYNK